MTINNNNKNLRVFGGKLDEFLASKGGEIVQETKRVSYTEDYESSYLQYKCPSGHIVTETKQWNAWSFGFGAVKIRTAGKGQALIYTKSGEEVPLSTVELKEELDDYLLLFEEEIKAAEEEAKRLEKERRLREEAAKLERANKENWEKEVPALIETIMDKEVHYSSSGKDCEIRVTTRQICEYGRYREIPCIRISCHDFFDSWSHDFNFEFPEEPLTTGNVISYQFEKAPEGVKTHGDLYEYIKTH